MTRSRWHALWESAAAFPLCQERSGLQWWPPHALPHAGVRPGVHPLWPRAGLSPIRWEISCLGAQRHFSNAPFCFSLIQDVPYLDVAPYMPEYYKPHNLLDFEERLPSSDSLSLHSFTSFTSTNLEWDDSAIAPSSEGKTLWFLPERLSGMGWTG